MTRTLLFFTVAALACAQDYTLGPESQPQPNVPKGAVTKAVLAPGKFYPGTPHNYQVYVPAQYDAAKPTPFMIFLDGSGAAGNGTRVPVVFDNLIAKHDLPPMIGIFVDPGVLPAATPDAQSRFERCFEYDSTSDRYSRFLLEELIPEVAKKYNLSKDPNDRGLHGVSTGAVGAFMAAWNRPDQFHRVFSVIGTYVAMKGAELLPTWIRKTEPKPIRIFMQEGKNDHIAPGLEYGTFYAGSWPINNQVMYEALQSSGYDVKFVMGEDGHSGRHAASILPDALRWLWRDYPKPIVVKEPAEMTNKGWDPRGKVYATVWADKPWQQVGATYGAVTSPTGDRDGNVYFADASANRIYKSDAEGKVTVFKEGTGGTRVLRIGGDGRLYAAQPAKKRIVSYGATGDEKVVAQNVEVTDMAITAKGAIYYTDATHKTVALWGKPPLNVADQIATPTGIALSPDQAMLIVTDALGRFSWSYQLAADGSVVNGEPFYRLEVPESGWQSGVVASTEDAIGQVYFATPMGVQVAEANGRIAMILNPPEIGAITSVTFAGKDQDWLYVSEGGKLFRRASKMKGIPSWAPAKLPRPPL